jgi:hypothetical protein
VLLIAGFSAFAPSTASANHVPNVIYGGSDSAGYPVQLQTRTDDIRFYSEWYCGGGIITDFIQISGPDPHYFSGSNFQGTFELSGQFPSPGVVTGHIVVEQCGIDLTFQAIAGAEPPPPPPCTPETVLPGFTCSEPGSGATPPATSPSGEDDSFACEQANDKVYKLKQKLKQADSADEKAKVKKKLKKAKKAEQEACA